MECGEKLPTQALPARRTEVNICSDCGVYDLPHTD